MDSNFIIHPEHWVMFAKIAEKPGETDLWRVSYGEINGLTDEEIRARLPMKFDAFLPGPRPAKYVVKACSPYRIHQRIVDHMVVDRVCLAGDAAHLISKAFVLLLLVA